MKKTFVKGLALGFLGSLVMAGSAMALPLAASDGGAALQVILDDNLTTTLSGGLPDYTAGSGINASNESGIDVWTGSEGDSESYAISILSGPALDFGVVSASYGSSYSLADGSGGYYDFQVKLNISSLLKELEINDVVVDTNFGSDFGFYYGTIDTMDVPDSVASYLLNGQTYFVDGTSLESASGGDDWVLAWDTGSTTFTDAVYLVEDINPVPEPATMLLFGTGLASLATLRRRKAKK